jgi:hypothetical protein
MRALRVVGLSEDGESVICEDPTRSERFAIPADERLRAAARGDITRLGQIAIELESQMRPREIQTRVRAGESVDQIAAASGLPAHKVEKFAYPVLLERSRTAELAQRAHPVREDGPDVQTLAEVAAHAFGLRGQDYSSVTWDSWRGDDGKWVVELHWQTGRSENRAHWAFHPGAHGGTVTPLDEHALDLMDPNAPNRPLRTVRPVTELAKQALDVAPAPSRQVVVEPIEPDEVDEPVAPVRAPSRSAVVEPEPVAAFERTEAVEPDEPIGTPELPTVASEPAASVAPVAEEPELELEAPTAPEATPAPEQPAAAAPGKPATPPKRGKKNHPIVPSWEDVLLGVRGQRG